LTRMVHVATRIAALALLALAVSSRAAAPIAVRVDAFDVRGDVPPATIEKIRLGIAAWLEADGCVNASIEPRAPADYVVQVTLTSPGIVGIVALEVGDARNDADLWADNYDYTSVPPATMADDVLTVLRRTEPPCNGT